MKSKQAEKNLFEEAAHPGGRKRKSAKRAESRTKPLSFRAEPELQAVLHAKAAEKNISVSDFLRESVVARLKEDDAKESMFDFCCEIRREIHELQKDVLVATEAILLSIGTHDKEEIRQWSQVHLRAGLRLKPEQNQGK